MCAHGVCIASVLYRQPVRPACAGLAQHMVFTNTHTQSCVYTHSMHICVKAVAAAVVECTRVHARSSRSTLHGVARTDVCDFEPFARWSSAVQVLCCVCGFLAAASSIVSV